MGLRIEVHCHASDSKEESELLENPNVKTRAISSQARCGEKPLSEKVQRLSRKGVGRKRVRSAPAPEGVDDIVCAAWKHADVPVDHRFNCLRRKSKDRRPRVNVSMVR